MHAFMHACAELDNFKAARSAVDVGYYYATVGASIELVSMFISMLKLH